MFATEWIGLNFLVFFTRHGFLEVTNLKQNSHHIPIYLYIVFHMYLIQS